MELKIGKTYYSQRFRTIFKVSKMLEPSPYDYSTPIEEMGYIGFSTEMITLEDGCYYPDRNLYTGGHLIKHSVCIDAPDKPSPFDKAKKAYNTYMATIRAIEQQVKDNINHQTN